MFFITLSDIIIMSDRVVRRNENMPPIAVSQAKEIVSTA